MTALRHASFRELPRTDDRAPRVLERCGPRQPLPPVASPDPRAFHASLPGYRQTPLTELPRLAQALGLERIWVKDESERFGLPAFKVLGASWAAFLMLCERFDLEPAQQRWPFVELAAAARAHGTQLVAATDGNHGRALAYAARLFGCTCTILVPAGTADARIEAIAGEGAVVEVCDGSYDDAIAAAAALADERRVVVSDTSWEGYHRIPQWVSDGYSTIFRELDAQLGDLGERPDVVFVQTGVGALAAAVIRHFAASGGPENPHVVVVEPLTAACALAAAEVGGPALVPGPHPSVMAGLNCGAVSPLAAPLLDAAVSAYCAISDELAEEAVRILAAEGVEAGETGAAGLAGLLALHRSAPDALGGAGAGWRRALVIVTEGVTDPVTHARALAAGGQTR